MPLLTSEKKQDYKKLNKTAKDVAGQVKHAPETAISQKHGET